MNDQRVGTAALRAPAGLGDLTATGSTNKHTVRLSLYASLALLDSVALTIASGCSAYWHGARWLGPNGIGLGIAIIPLYGLMAFRGSAYSMHALRSGGNSVGSAMSALVATTMALLFFMFVGQFGDDISRLVFLTTIAGGAVLISAGRYAFNVLVSRRKIGALVDEVLVVDGVPFDSTTSARVIDASLFGLRPDFQDPVMLARLSSHLANADRVIVASVPERQHDWSLLLKGMNIIGEIVSLEGNSIGAIGVARFAGQHTVVVSRGPLDIANRAKKRAIDVAFAVAALIALAPLLLIVAIAIKLETKGPVFFRQARVGRDNRIFKIVKFRSMRVETCDANGNRSTARDDDRITRVGRFIRKTSIDELPQLFNVLDGDMSLVGPRPHALGSMAGDKLFWEVTERYWLRHSLKPGITGLAQVRGLRGATDDYEDLEKRLQADLEYIANWRLWSDIVIVFRTAMVLVHNKAY